MDILYRIFYTVFSMSCMAIFLFPFFLFFRFLIRKMPRKYSMCMWLIFYIRLVCPFGMSSPVCLVSSWNRGYHLLLREIGLEILPDRGLLTGWRSVYQGEIRVTKAYTICTGIALAGSVGILLFYILRQWRIKSILKNATLLFENVYESEWLDAPLRTGWIYEKIYFPTGYRAAEMKNALIHQKKHEEYKDNLRQRIYFLISLCHWWNPIVWFALIISWYDTEIACDEAVIQTVGREQGKSYIQTVLNMHREDAPKVRNTYFSFPEKWVKSRAEHLIYCQTVGKRKEIASLLGLLLLAVFSFGLSALHISWNGSKMTYGTEADQGELFQKTENKIKNKVLFYSDVKRPDDTSVRLELVMLEGNHITGKGYDGTFELRMSDADGEIDCISLSAVFDEGKTQFFPETVFLQSEDYNEDGICEISIGQKKKNKDQVEYYLFGVKKDKLVSEGGPLILSDVPEIQWGSTLFSVVEGTGGIISTKVGENTYFYVWKDKDKKYTQKKMTLQEVEAIRESQSDKTKAGEEFTYTLKNNSGVEVMQVDTKTDQTGSKVIQKVVLYPKGINHSAEAEKYENIRGYYCEVKWVQVDEDTDRFAEIIYNGTRGRTFVLYDLKNGKAAYYQEDGNTVLKKLFQKYGEKEYHFTQKGTILYNLMEIANNNLLTINFVADTKEGTTIKGCYRYNLAKKQASDLQFSIEE